MSFLVCSITDISRNIQSDQSIWHLLSVTHLYKYVISTHSYLLIILTSKEFLFFLKTPSVIYFAVKQFAGRFRQKIHLVSVKSTIPPISTKSTITSHPKQLHTKRRFALKDLGPAKDKYNNLAGLNRLIRSKSFLLAESDDKLSTNVLTCWDMVLIYIPSGEHWL